MSQRKKHKRVSRMVTAMSNPIAKALEKRDTLRWQSEMFAYLDQLQPGQECRQALEHILCFIAPAMKSIEGWDDPDNVGDVMCDAVSVVCDLINSGSLWNPECADVIKRGISDARHVICGMPVEHMARSKAFTDQLLVRATA